MKGISPTNFGEIICLALTEPQRLDKAAPATIILGLDARQAVETRIQAVCSLTALAYSRPEMVSDGILASLVAALNEVAPALADAVSEAFQFLAALGMPVSAGITAMADSMGRRGLARVVRKPLLRALCYIVQWQSDLFKLEEMLRAAEASCDTAERDLMLSEVIERLIFARPDQFTPAIVDQIAAAFSDCLRLRYTLAFISAHPNVDYSARNAADRWLEKRFRPRSITSFGISQNPLSILVVQNIDDGQGDEIIRIYPLVQALLDWNAFLTVTILTRRTYLYDHPRVIAKSIHDDKAVEHQLTKRFDGILEFYEPQVVRVNYRPELATRLKQYIAVSRPRLLLRASKGHNHFTFDTVEIGNESLTHSLALDRVSARNVYDPVQRLLIEFGLPQRIGDVQYATPSLLTGTPSPEAEAAWNHLQKKNRPVALLNAFGGREPLKGFTDKAILAAHITALVDEGFQVLVLPNGQSWGSLDVIAGVLLHLDDAHRTDVAIAPDPTRPEPGVDEPSKERPELSESNRVMRLFKYFATYADLVVTVEGWLMHLAFALGRPFRLYLAPYSHGFDWHPRSRGPNQRLVAYQPPATVGNQDLFWDSVPPQPFRPRKELLMIALRGLRQSASSHAVPILLKVLASPDAHMRATALDALGQHGSVSVVKENLLTALTDRAACVRAAAARVLIDWKVDCSKQLGAQFRVQLQAHIEVARQNWQAIAALGTGALPVLSVAVQDVDVVIRREAQWTAARLLGKIYK